MYVYYLIFDVCSATGSQQDPRQLPSPHGGGDVQRRVSVLSRTQVKGFGLRYFRPFFIFETMSRQFPTTYWDRRRYLVLLRDVTLGANEDAHDSRVTVAPAGVQRSIAIL